MSDISVILPVRNGAATLADALSSILRCSEVGEVIVVDDGSSDGSAEIAERMGDARLRIVPGPSTGIPGALNAGIWSATLEYIVRCDADDRIVAESLAARRDWLTKHSDYVSVSGAYETTTPYGELSVDFGAKGAPRDVTNLLRKGETVTHFGSWLTRRRTLLQISGARPWFTTAEDLDLQFRLAGQGAVWHDPRPAYIYRLNETSITHEKPRELLEFYDMAARRFALQRRAWGTDDLEAGHPPKFVLESPIDATPFGVRQQVAGHLEGAAWRRHGEGYRGEALRLLLRSVSAEPHNLRRWKGLAAMVCSLKKTETSWRKQ